MSDDSLKSEPGVGLFGAMAAGAAAGALTGYHVEALLLKPGQSSGIPAMFAGTILGAALAGLVWIHEDPNRGHSRASEATQRNCGAASSPLAMHAARLQKKRASIGTGHLEI